MQQKLRPICVCLLSLPIAYFQIVNPNMDDSGLYECQVSYHDDTEKKLKMPFSLKVLGTYRHKQFRRNKHIHDELYIISLGLK